MEIVFFLGIAIVIMAASYFFYLGFRDSEKVSWVNITIGVGLLLLCCGWVIITTIYDWGLIAFFQILFGSGVAVLSGISLMVFLERWKKVVGLIVAIGVPLILYASLEIALSYSPNELIHKDGEAIAKALDNYYLDNKTYPQTLNELLPDYVTDLREPKSIWGWLYIGDSKDFSLGYVSYIDKWGYTICKYSASSPKWDCPLDSSTAPFHLAPTPLP